MTDTLKVPDVRPRVQYAGDGSLKVFSFSFPVFKSDDLAVLIDGALQSGGYSVAGAGKTEGGSVSFDAAPANGAIITLERRLPIERLNDFIEGGRLSAAALNAEFDYLTAALQQVAEAGTGALRVPDDEISAGLVLPGKTARAGKVLAFDGSGNPSLAEPDNVTTSPDYTATGTGAVTRSLADKVADIVSVQDFGALGDGTTDDTSAIINALSAHDAVFLPPGTYRITGTIELASNKTLVGAGQSSVIKTSNNSFDAIALPGEYATLANLRIDGGQTGIKLFGRDAPCVNNSLHDLVIDNADTGILLDGYTDTNKPCYWNNFDRVLVLRPLVHGIHLTKTGAGDTANANRFHQARVYSLAANTSGDGIRLEHARFNNAFTDCEVNLNTTASACVRVMDGCDKNLFVNLYTETLAAIDNVRLEAGSVETSIINLFSASAGPAINDLSGGEYVALNAGFPEKNRLKKTRISELIAEFLRMDTEYVQVASAATIDPDLTASVYLLAASGGQITFRLPDPGQVDGNGNELVNGGVFTIKKVDVSTNPVVVTENGGPGPDGRSVTLASLYDYVTVVSNGASWWIVASNVTAENTEFHSGSGTFTPDIRKRLYLLSATAALTAELPPANAADVAGRVVTIKKNDATANIVTVTEAGATGPDGEAIELTAKGHAVSVISDGAAWHILSRNS